MTDTFASKHMIQRPFAAFDLDGTLVRWQLYHAIVDKLAEAGYIDPTDYRRVVEARTKWKKRDSKTTFRDYELVLIEAYENTLPKLTTQQFDQAVEAAFHEHKEQVYTFTRNFIKDLKAKGYVLLAISGSHIEAVQKIAEHYGFHDSAGTIYHRDKGSFTGQKTFAAQDKKRTLLDLINKHNLTLEGSIAVGDGDSDIGMLQMVERPIAFNPTKTLLDYAMKNSWEVVIERKNVIYNLLPENSCYILKHQ